MLTGAFAHVCVFFLPQDKGWILRRSSRSCGACFIPYPLSLSSSDLQPQSVLCCSPGLEVRSTRFDICIFFTATCVSWMHASALTDDACFLFSGSVGVVYVFVYNREHHIYRSNVQGKR